MRCSVYLSILYYSDASSCDRTKLVIPPFFCWTAAWKEVRVRLFTKTQMNLVFLFIVPTTACSSRNSTILISISVIDFIGVYFTISIIIFNITIFSHQIVITWAGDGYIIWMYSVFPRRINIFVSRTLLLCSCLDMCIFLPVEIRQE